MNLTLLSARSRLEVRRLLNFKGSIRPVPLRSLLSCACAQGPPIAWLN
jgi:hypothetical protein